MSGDNWTQCCRLAHKYSCVELHVLQMQNHTQETKVHQSLQESSTRASQRDDVVQGKSTIDIGREPCSLGVFVEHVQSFDIMLLVRVAA